LAWDVKTLLNKPGVLFVFVAFLSVDAALPCSRTHGIGDDGLVHHLPTTALLQPHPVCVCRFGAYSGENYRNYEEPGSKQAFEMPGYRQDFAATILGWALFPGKLVYQDGSTWDLKAEGQCFDVLLAAPRASSVKRATPIVRRNARGLSFVR
jgi:hypothetical protein